MIESTKVTVGTAETILVKSDTDPQHVYISNLQPGNDVGELSRDGHVHLAFSRFTLANNGTAHFQITTGSSGAQFEFYEIVATSSTVYAELLEGATFGSATPVSAYNLNRNDTRALSSTLSAATAVAGGTAVSAEFVPASNQAGGAQFITKIHTLEPNSSYVFRFTDVGGNGAGCYFQVGISEQFNGKNVLYLGAAGSAAVLMGGESTEFSLFPGDTLVGQALDQDIQVGVMRQVY